MKHQQAVKIDRIFLFVCQEAHLKEQEGARVKND